MNVSCRSEAFNPSAHPPARTSSSSWWKAFSCLCRRRHKQENGFHHGVERWGINQLDGRKVDDYPPDAIIPNPARGRLDRALRLVRAEEWTARCAPHLRRHAEAKR
jgi:hypothetical protein